MTLYELLGVDPKAETAAIKKAYQKLAKVHHPDKGGDPEKFLELQEAFEVLSDAERRLRYDTTGRADKSAVTPARVKNFIEQTIKTLIESKDPMGYRDDPTTNNFRDQILGSLVAARKQIKDMKFATQRKIEKATRMVERFKTKEGFDPVGDALRANLKSLQGELRTHEDALELSQEVERVMRTYEYEVGPEREGQERPGPTDRRSGLRYIK